MFYFRSDFSSENLGVDRNLLCQRSPFVNRLCEQDPNKYSLKLPRDFRDAYQSIANYIEKDIVLVGPGKLEPDSREAVEHTDSMPSPCCFAEFYEMDDLANRSMDILRAHEYQCCGTLLGRHFRDTYENTRKGSKLRHYCAVATACFLSNAQDTVEHQAGSAAITNLFRLIPQFEHDVRKAQSNFRENIRAEKVDCNSDDNQFGPCEFHTHRRGGTCHLTGEITKGLDALTSLNDGIRDSEDNDTWSMTAVVGKVSLATPASMDISWS